MSLESSVNLDTVPKLLLRNAKAYASRPAMRHKDFGIWQTWTWAQMRDEVRSLAVGLRKLGVERGDAVAIIGDNRPRLYATFAAVQSIGGIAVPVYQDSVADEMAYVLDHAEVKFAVVQNQEQVDKLLSIADRLPKLTHHRLRRAARACRLRPHQPALLRACAGAGTRGDAHATPAPPAGGSTRSPTARAPTSA